MNKNNSMNTILAIITGIVIIVVSMILMNMVKVKITDDYLVIKGLYGQRIKADEILEVKTLDSLPLIGIRTNGIGLGFMNIGNFSYSGIGNVRLFEIKREKPYVLVKTNNETIIIGLGKKRNMEILDELNKKLN